MAKANPTLHKIPNEQRLPATKKQEILRKDNEHLDTGIQKKLNTRANPGSTTHTRPKRFNIKNKKMKQQTIILASTSPRRHNLLKTIIKDFKIIPSNYEEDMTLNLKPEELAKTLSYNKASNVAKNQKGIIIGSDTFISLGNEVLGKPHTPKKAKQMLRKLSGKTHNILTGLTVINTETNKKIRHCEIIRITFKKLTNKEIEEYIATKEPLDKAGAYALQGLAKKFIINIQGSRSAAIGLPLEKLSIILNNMGIKTK